MGTLSPWGSRPVGDPMVPLGNTYQRDVGRPLTPYPSTSLGPSTPRDCSVRSTNKTARMGRHSQKTLWPRMYKLHQVELDFKQYSFDHVAQALRDGDVNVFRLPPAFPTCYCPLHLSDPGQSDSL